MSGTAQSETLQELRKRLAKEDAAHYAEVARLEASLRAAIKAERRAESESADIRDFLTIAEQRLVETVKKSIVAHGTNGPLKRGAAATAEAARRGGGIGCERPVSACVAAICRRSAELRDKIDRLRDTAGASSMEVFEAFLETHPHVVASWSAIGRLERSERCSDGGVGGDYDDRNESDAPSVTIRIPERAAGASSAITPIRKMSSAKFYAKYKAWLSTADETTIMAALERATVPRDERISSMDGCAGDRARLVAEATAEFGRPTAREMFATHPALVDKAAVLSSARSFVSELRTSPALRAACALEFLPGMSIFDASYSDMAVDAVEYLDRLLSYRRGGIDRRVSSCEDGGRGGGGGGGRGRGPDEYYYRGDASEEYSDASSDYSGNRYPKRDYYYCCEDVGDGDDQMGKPLWRTGSPSGAMRQRGRRAVCFAAHGSDGSLQTLYVMRDELKRFDDPRSAFVVSTRPSNSVECIVGVLRSRPGSLRIAMRDGFSAGLDGRREDYAGGECSMARSFFAELEDFGCDPVEYLKRVGKKIGMCCVCQRVLNERTSLSLGMGPVCVAAVMEELSL
jgi:hypothetical protein